MSDIFLSYAREDKQRAGELARALEQNGWSVWWDRKIPPGKTFSSVIEAAIDASKCVIVLWSKDSTASDWVHNEASEGARKKTLVPALIDPVKIPFEFRRIQAADLTDWKAHPGHPGFANLIAAVSQFTGAPVAEVNTAPAQLKKVTPDIPVEKPPEEKRNMDSPTPRPRRSRKRVITYLAVAAVLAAAVGWYYSVITKKNEIADIDRQFSQLVSTFEHHLEIGANTNSLEELEEVDNKINMEFEGWFEELRARAQKHNFNGDPWVEQIVDIKIQWQEVSRARRSALTAPDRPANFGGAVQ